MIKCLTHNKLTPPRHGIRSASKFVRRFARFFLKWSSSKIMQNVIFHIKPESLTLIHNHSNKHFLVQFFF